MFHVKLVWVVFLVLPFFVVAQEISVVTLQDKNFPAMPAKVSEIVDLLETNKQYKALSNDQKDWFYWTNYSRLYPKEFWMKVIEPVLNTFPNLRSSYSNSLRQDLMNSGSLSFLYPDSTLLLMSLSHAADLSTTKGGISHTSSNGTTFQQRTMRFGVKWCAAENLSLGPMNTVLSLILLYIDQGLPNVGHRRNLLNASYGFMGVAVANSGANTVVVQNFGCQQR